MNSKIFLPKNTTIDNGRYKVRSVLGNGGFGITYLCENSLRKKFAIKEYFPNTLVNRDLKTNNLYLTSSSNKSDYDYGKENFLNEANILVKFSHPNIANIMELFEENNTAYIVMEYINGTTLSQYIQKNGILNEEKAKNISIQILDALKDIHSHKLLHRDIKPDNIFITSNGKPILIDFGSARFIFTNKSNHISTIVSHGYAPPEQYRQKIKFLPSSDIYSLGATIYYATTNIVPPSSLDRKTLHSSIELKNISDINNNISNNFKNFIYKAMELNPRNRFKTVDIAIITLLEDKTINHKTINIHKRNLPYFPVILIIVFFAIYYLFDINFVDIKDKYKIAKQQNSIESYQSFIDDAINNYNKSDYKELIREARNNLNILTLIEDKKYKTRRLNIKSIKIANPSTWDDVSSSGINKYPDLIIKIKIDGNLVYKGGTFIDAGYKLIDAYSKEFSANNYSKVSIEVFDDDSLSQFATALVTKFLFGESIDTEGIQEIGIWSKTMKDLNKKNGKILKFGGVSSLELEII